MQSELVAQELPHYFEVKIQNHPNGVPQICCGKEEDAILMCERYPGSTWEKIYLPHPPQTVDVPHVAVAPDLVMLIPKSMLNSLMQSRHTKAKTMKVSSIVLSNLKKKTFLPSDCLLLL